MPCAIPTGGRFSAYRMMLAVIQGVLWIHVALGLECWSCIADDCHLDPARNYKATKSLCLTGESCQKVEYKGRDSHSSTDYFSVVRSCSQGSCRPHSDNCSEKLLTNPGCMVRHCCDTGNLCNHSNSRHDGVTPLAALCLAIFLLLR